MENISDRLVFLLRDYRADRLALAALLLALADSEIDLMTDLEVCATKSGDKQLPAAVNTLRANVALLAQDVLPIIKSYIERQNTNASAD